MSRQPRRQTVKIASLVRWANNHLSNSEDCASRVREGVIGLVEAALHDAGAYVGFGYQASEFAAPGQLREGYDDTRRCYYLPVWVK